MMMKNKFNRIHFSSIKGEWNTPQEFFLFLNSLFHFTFDPCKPPVIGNFKGNGLKEHWGKRVFCNMPYDEVMKWISWGWMELCEGKTVELIAFLIPGRPDTEWFDRLYKWGGQFYKIKGRLRFSNHNNSAPFPSMVCVLNWKNPLEYWKKLKIISEEEYLLELATRRAIIRPQYS